MDLKVKPRSDKGYKFILGIIDEVTNYLRTTPIHQSKSEEKGNALIESVITKYRTTPLTAIVSQCVINQF